MEEYINGDCHHDEDSIILQGNKTSTISKELLKPYQYLIAIPGKNIRQILVSLLNHWLKVPEDKLRAISKIISTLHHYSLLLDDIQDGSMLRRGIPAAHLIYGVENTILSATFIDLLNMEEAQTLNHPQIARMYVNSAVNMWEGQGNEIHWREKHKCPTVEEYLQMIEKKTGGLFLLTHDLMKLFSTTNVDATRFLKAFGLYFQILDDYQNLNSNIYHDSKGFCEDLSEGKFSFPIIHAITSNPRVGKTILGVLEKRTQDVELKKHCISLIEQCGSFEYTRKVLAELKAIIYEEVDKLQGNPYFDKLFCKINIV